MKPNRNKLQSKEGEAGLKAVSTRQSYKEKGYCKQFQQRKRFEAGKEISLSVDLLVNYHIYLIIIHEISPLSPDASLCFPRKAEYYSIPTF